MSTIKELGLWLLWMFAVVVLCGGLSFLAIMLPDSIKPWRLYFKFWRCIWRALDATISRSPSKVIELQNAREVRIYLLFDDGNPKSHALEQYELCLTREQWASLSRMKSLAQINVEITEEGHSFANISADLYPSKVSPMLHDCCSCHQDEPTH